MNKFNGHTWIVAIIAILSYTIIAITEIVIGYQIIKITHTIWLRFLLKGCIITVPIQMGLSIKSLMKRLTYDKTLDKDNK